MYCGVQWLRGPRLGNTALYYERLPITVPVRVFDVSNPQPGVIIIIIYNLL